MTIDQATLDLLTAMAAEIKQLKRRLSNIESASRPNLLFTPGSILFGDTLGNPGQDNANLFWDDANNRLGVGLATPGYQLDLRGYGGKSQLHIGATSSDDGMYLMGISANGSYVSSGCRYNGTNWVASATDAEIIEMTAGIVRFYQNTGLTPGNTFTPTSTLAMTSTGHLSLPPATNTLQMRQLAIANLGVSQLADSAVPQGFLFIYDTSGGIAIYKLDGASHSTQEQLDVNGVYSPTAGTASSSNIYWSAGNSRYEIENRRGGALSYYIWLMNIT